MATSSDLDGLVEGNVRMAQETESLHLDPDRLRRGVDIVLRQECRGRYWVETEGGALRGQLLITYEWSDWRAADVWWIQSVYVWPQHRRQGVFRALFERVETEARAANAAGLRLYVESANHRAQSTYGSLGMDGDHYRMFQKMFDHQ